MGFRSFRARFGGGGVSAPVEVCDVEFASVCDCDVNAIAAWQVWRALQADVLVQAGQMAVLRMMAVFGCFPESAVSELHQLTAEIAADAASRTAVAAGVAPPNFLPVELCSGLKPLVSEQPEGIE